MQNKTADNELQQILRLDGHIQDIYLAVYANKILLLDGCCRPDVDLIVATIRNILGREVSQLKAVIVTHMHADHAGGAAYLKKQTGCKIISADKPNQWYGGLNGRIEYLLDLSLSYFVAYRRGRKFKNLNYPAKLKADILVSDGDAVPMFEDWQIIETPGHTDRDLSVYHAQTGKIYVADLIIRLESRKRGIRFVTPYNIDDPATYKKSVAKIKQYHPNKVMMAHGGQIFVEQKIFDELIKMTPDKARTNKHAYYDVVFRIATSRKPKK